MRTPADRPHVLADLVDLDQPEAAIDDLLEMPEPDFDDAVRAYLRGGGAGSEIMRSEEVADRTFEALGRLLGRYEGLVRFQSGEALSSSRQVLAQLRAERRAVFPLVQEVPEVMGTVTLADVLPVEDYNAAVERLISMEESEYDRAVLLWLLGGRAGTDIFRDDDVVEETYDALNRLRDRLADPMLAAQLALPPEDVRRLRAAVPEERRAARRLAHDIRLERHQSRGAVGLDARALRELGRRHRRELLEIRRALREQDEAAETV